MGALETLFLIDFELNLGDLEKKPAWFWQNIFRDVAQIRNFIGGGTVIIFIDIPFSIIFISIIYLIAPPNLGFYFFCCDFFSSCLVGF